MTAATLFNRLCWSNRLSFLTCIDAAFQPPTVLPSPGSRKTGRNQPEPAGTSRKGK